MQAAQAGALANKDDNFVTMEIRDYLSFVAILLSVASFIVSLRAASFTRRSKAAELRAEVLNKYADAKYALLDLQRYFSDIRREAEAMEDQTLLKMADHDAKLDEFCKGLEGYWQYLVRLPPDSGVKVYEKLFHKVHAFVSHISSFKQMTESAVIAHKNKRKQGPTSP